MYTILDRYSEDDDIAPEDLFHDGIAPSQALIEDEDGFRALWAGSKISHSVWQRAHEAGAVWIIRHDLLAYAEAATFVEQKQEDGRFYRFASWVPWDGHGYVQSILDNVAEPEHTSRFVNIHTHSEFSSLDGLSTPLEIARRVKEMGQTAVAVTDHGVCAGHPLFQKVMEDAGVKPLLGIEAYFVKDRFERVNQHDYWHLVLIAMNNQGLKNIWAMSTESHKSGLYGKPRIDWEILERYSEGVIATTACLRGPVIEPYLRGSKDGARMNLARLLDIFGDRLYVELHTNSLEQQIDANQWTSELAREMGVPSIAVCDSHYCDQEDQPIHQVWIAIAAHKVKTLADDDKESTLFAGKQDYHLHDEHEVRKALRYLDSAVVEESIENTSLLAERCDARIEGHSHKPLYHRRSQECPDPARTDAIKLREVCLRRWDERTQNKSKSSQIYRDRFEVEIEMLIDKGFAGYMLMVWDVVAWARGEGILMTPGRGSGTGSLVAYLLGITETDPIEYDIMFERFMTKGRTELPDFDMDFPSTRKSDVFAYISQRWGSEHVATVGTQGRLKNKSSFKDVFRALRVEGAEEDLAAISQIVDDAEVDTAGLGLSWDALMDKAGDELEPYRLKYPEPFHYASKVTRRLRAYGKHPAGVVIDPDGDLTQNLPLRNGDEGQMVAQFDLGVLESLGYVKFDFLNLSNLDILQKAKDLIEEHTGKRIDPTVWTEDELSDPLVFDEISRGRTLGMFQIATSTGVRMCKRYQPTTLRELSHVITLVRPGPKNSGLTDTYLRRRFGEEDLSYADPRMERILAPTQGAMIFQEQLMQLCMELASYDDVEADRVRKILGKKKVEQIEAEGHKFFARAVENDTDPDVARDLWEQMAEFAKYSFGYGHALAYAMFAYWTAWFKVHYPLYFLCAALSVVADDKVSDFVEEAKRMGYRVLPPDINVSKMGFTIDSEQMAIRYGFGQVKGVGPVAARHIVENQPYTDWNDFDSRRTGTNEDGKESVKVQANHINILNRLGAFESITGHRKWLERKLNLESITGSGSCVFRDDAIESETGLPCSFDWTSLPLIVGKTGKPLKKQPGPPKKCTKACKQFTPRTPEEPEAVPRLSNQEISQIEMEVLGSFLTATPFDRVPEHLKDSLSTAEDVLEGTIGLYKVLGLIKAVRKKTDRNGKTYAFVTFTTDRGELDCICFSSDWLSLHTMAVPGALCLASMDKNDRGQNLQELVNLDAKEDEYV